MEVVLALLLIVSISPSIEAKLPYGFSIDLIHRDSRFSPFYDPSINQSETLRNAAMRSIFRANTVFHLNTTAYGSKSQAPIIRTQGDYLMKFSVGTPPVDSFGIVDTGSDLIWMQCIPCEDCYVQKHPFFDPKKSSTYQVVSCHSQTCDLVPIRACGASTVCRYENSYVDGSLTAGVLGSDSISFDPFRRVLFPNILFGCGHVNTGTFKPGSTGIVGLGRGHLSLVSQLGYEVSHKFLYCLVPRHSEATSKIKFGWEATIYRYGSVSVPLVDKAPSSFYQLSLEEIYIAKDAVSPAGTSDIIIDSGTTLTFLETSWYERVEAAVIEAYGDDREPINKPPAPFTLCYLDGTTKDLPNITFSFSGVKKGLQFNSYNVFASFNHLLCLMIAPTKGSSILGSLAQVNFKVLYDLQAKTVSFAPADCTRE